MKRHLLQTACALLAATTLTTAWAGPLQRRQIAADVTWMVHLDVDGLKQTKLGQNILEEMEKPDAQFKLSAFQAMFNFDPRKSLKGVTLYSRGPSPSDAVLLLYGEFDTNQLVSLTKAGKNYQDLSHRDYTIHSWMDDRRPGGARVRTFAAIHTNGVVILGQKHDRIAAALDVLDRMEPAIASAKDFPTFAADTSSAYLLAAVRQTDLSRLSPQAAMLKTFKALTVVGQETDGTLKLELQLIAENEEAAKGIQQIAQGMVALGALNERPELARLAQAVTVSRNVGEVNATFKLPVIELIETIKQAGAGKRPKR